MPDGKLTGEAVGTDSLARVEHRRQLPDDVPVRVVDARGRELVMCALRDPGEAVVQDGASRPPLADLGEFGRHGHHDLLGGLSESMRPSFGFGKGPSWTATSTTATEPPGPHVPRRRRA